MQDRDTHESGQAGVQAGVDFLRDFYCCEWGSRTAITEQEARAVVKGILGAVFFRHDDSQQVAVEVSQ